MKLIRKFEKHSKT